MPGAARRGHGVGTHSEPSRTPTPREVVHSACALPEGLNPAVSGQQGSGPAGLLENFLRRVQRSSGPETEGNSEWGFQGTPAARTMRAGSLEP